MNDRPLPPINLRAVRFLDCAVIRWEAPPPPAPTQVPMSGYMGEVFTVECVEGAAANRWWMRLVAWFKQ